MRTWLTLTLIFVSASSGAETLTEIRARKLSDVKALAEKAGLQYPVDEVYLRALKKERLLEVWAGKRGRSMVLLKTYPFCAASGHLGPKRREGDSQVPEGLYEVAQFNPFSAYHLSLKVSYPNESDRRRSDLRHPGGLIYLHGNCASIGCIAIEDGPIEEVYLLAQDARHRPIRFDIFPGRLTPQGLRSLSPSAHVKFWAELAPAYVAFEATRRPAAFSVARETGAYIIR